MEFIESRQLKLRSGVIVWMKAAETDRQDLYDALQPGQDTYAPRLIVETGGGVRHEVQLSRQTRPALTAQLEAWITPAEAQIIVERFGIVFHTELDGEVISEFYELLD